MATDTYSFERLRKDGCFYVDTTGLLYPPIDKSLGGRFFLPYVPEEAYG
jgi:hypothetical protein